MHYENYYLMGKGASFVSMTLNGSHGNKIPTADV